MVFTRSYKPGDDPLFFINGHIIPPVTKFKFLGLLFDYKLQWKEHISSVIFKCIRLKNIFSIISKLNYGPSTKTLIHLFKSLVGRVIDYGLIAYGSAARTSLEKIDTTARSILRIILGSRASTPIEILYLDSGVVPLKPRRSLLSTKYLINLVHNRHNPTFTTAQDLANSPITWSPRSIPCLFDGLMFLRRSNLPQFFSLASTITPIFPIPSPSTRLDAHRILWFPLSKKTALRNGVNALPVFNSLISSFSNSALFAYSDGSLSPDTSATSCAFVIPRLNISKS